MPTVFGPGSYCTSCGWSSTWGQRTASWRTRYEHASLVLNSNLPFSGWGSVLGDQAVAAAMIDRIVHHADVLTLKGASYRLRNRGIDTLPSIRTQNPADWTPRTGGLISNRRIGPRFERRRQRKEARSHLHNTGRRVRRWS